MALILALVFRFQSDTSWTDDLPVCHLSGVGFATNQIYREDGFRREEHEFEDRSIHVRLVTSKPERLSAWRPARYEVGSRV